MVLYHINMHIICTANLHSHAFFSWAVIILTFMILLIYLVLDLDRLIYILYINSLSPLMCTIYMYMWICVIDVHDIMYIHINIVSLIHCLRTVRQNQSNKNHQVKKYMYITYKYIFQVINTLTLTVSFKTVKNELLVLSISVKTKHGQL